MSTNKSSLEKLIKEAVSNVLQSTGKLEETVTVKPTTLKEAVISKAKTLLKEAVILTPRTFVLKSDVQSPTTKENHEKLYKSYVDSFNKISSKLDTVPRSDSDNNNDSEFRRLKLDEVHNMNGVKLHELYFTNSGDLNSEIRADAVPFMRLARDWGTFDAWQLDFRACGMVAREGWAICYFDPFKQRYFNAFIEGHTMHLPLMCIPVLVMDTWHHAWFYDYPGDKMEYLNKSMREINWNVVEMRMLAAEMAKLHQLYAIQPVVGSEKERVITLGSAPPVEVLGKDSL
jgi:Fe-Mn family superoxide dismutase